MVTELSNSYKKRNSYTLLQGLILCGILEFVFNHQSLDTLPLLYTPQLI